MPTGQQMLALAADHIGERYVNILVPKNNPNWTGPWDCAEFKSWLVYQTGGFLYGCVTDNGNPATTEAYTGAWKIDARRKGRMIPWRDAAAIPGAVLLRYPPAPGSMGHIVVSDGRGGTVEAMGKRQGVTRGVVEGRHWDTGVLIPGLDDDVPAQSASLRGAAVLYGMDLPNMNPATVRLVQRALLAAGFHPGPIDGDFGPNTTAAVAAFQTVKGLVTDGYVGPQTARALGVRI